MTKARILSHFSTRNMAIRCISALQIFVVACGSHHEACDTACRQFVEMTRPERRESITTRSPQDQVALYCSVLRAVHPPDLGLADAVAAGGERVLPALLDRLATERSEITRANLIYLLLRMQKLGYYNAASDGNAMSTVRTSIDSMNDEFWKRTSESYVAKIQSGSKSEFHR